MGIKDWPGGIVTKDQVVPTGPLETGTASGIWTMDQAANYTKQGIWPTAGVINPTIAGTFSSFVYTANNAGLTVTNGIDLAGDGGLVWGKSRSAVQNHRLYDTEGNGLYSNYDYASFGAAGKFTANSDGFDLTASSGIVGGSGYGGPDYASWTFRKREKFFDIVTYTGDGTSGRQISHNLNATVGMILIKRTDASGGWRVYHRGANDSTNPEQWYAMLQSTNPFATASSVWNNTAPTSSVFTVGSDTDTNGNGGTFVAYLFAHDTTSESMIKCGHINTDGSGNASVDVGWEPQFVFWKADFSASGNEHGNWKMNDVIRGFPASDPANAFGYPSTIYANTDGAETINGVDGYLESSTGFGFGQVPGNSSYVYMAIRSPMMEAPTVATDVFNVTTRTGEVGNEGAYRPGFVTDMAFHKVVTNAINSFEIGSRITKLKSMNTNDTSAEVSQSDQRYDYMNGWNTETSSSSTKYSWMWKRAKGFFDVVSYQGNGVNGRQIQHSLGVTPEMIWVKLRNQFADSWMVYHKDLATNYNLVLDSTGQSADYSGRVRSPDSTTFTVSSDTSVNNTYSPTLYYQAYLWASTPGVSKCGIITGTGADQNIDCGFPNTARFVLLKKTNGTGKWFLFDSVRGITTADTDPFLALNDTAAQATESSEAGGNMIQNYASGFTVTNAGPQFTASGAEHIYYAIA